MSTDNFNLYLKIQSLEIMLDKLQSEKKTLEIKLEATIEMLADERKETQRYRTMIQGITDLTASEWNEV